MTSLGCCLCVCRRQEWTGAFKSHAPLLEMRRLFCPQHDDDVGSLSEEDSSLPSLSDSDIESDVFAKSIQEGLENAQARNPGTSGGPSSGSVRASGTCSACK